jgi:hypothetical protein
VRFKNRINHLTISVVFYSVVTKESTLVRNYTCPFVWTLQRVSSYRIATPVIYGLSHHNITTRLRRQVVSLGANGHNVIEIHKIAPAPEIHSIRRVEGNATVIKTVLKNLDGNCGPSEVFILSLTRMHCGNPRNRSLPSTQKGRLRKGIFVTLNLTECIYVIVD